jgi:hypothetical protein
MGMERERTELAPKAPLRATYVPCPAAIVRNGPGGPPQISDEQLLPNYPRPYPTALYISTAV